MKLEPLYPSDATFDVRHENHVREIVHTLVSERELLPPYEGDSLCAWVVGGGYCCG